ncbi:hypothetical protein Kfla_1441 [Kribbella flavida DSM 17836]|uniref:Uncharacterized protein n=1 Tax=Kribbella flavida (strain DSM 17836 / JCM 10339 / NBRC 14399) TaxID=479435 RepID=D2PKN0_KRIFD|nr:hypothetical protein [Kribbella flavida]ADB30542.1 hypothetical protein Kfla_1441 [Kribbella flavida DSM 17836]
MAGRHPASEVPDVGDGLWERIQDAVLAESGAAKTLWNGQLHYTDPNQRVRGSAAADGTVRLSRELVVRPLQEMYEQQGRPNNREQLIAWRNAVKTVAHEFSHLAAEPGFEHVDRALGMRRPEFTPIEEGTTEAWSQARLDRVIDRVLPPEFAAQLKSVRGVESYPAWAPAARAFAQSVGAEIGLDYREVLDQLNRAGRTGKGQVAADLLFDASELPSLVPTDAQAAVRAEIRAAIDQGFADLLPLRDDRSADLRTTSGQRGTEIAHAAAQAVRRAERRFQPPAAGERVVDRSQVRLEIISSPSRAERSGTAGDRPAATPSEGELAALRALLQSQSPPSRLPAADPAQTRPRATHTTSRPNDNRPRNR